MTIQLSDVRPAVINLTTCELDIICFADVEKFTVDEKSKKTIYHIDGVEYLQITSLDDHSEYMFHLGLIKSDTTNVINIHKVNSYDGGNIRNVYFDKLKKRFGSVASIREEFVQYLVKGLKENKRLDQLTEQFYKAQNETNGNKKSRSFLEFIGKKIRKI